MPTYDDSCPWCGKHLTDIWEYFAYNRNHETEAECESCEKPITITRQMEYVMSDALAVVLHRAREAS